MGRRCIREMLSMHHFGYTALINPAQGCNLMLVKALILYEKTNMRRHFRRNFG